MNNRAGITGNSRSVSSSMMKSTSDVELPNPSAIEPSKPTAQSRGASICANVLSNSRRRRSCVTLIWCSYGAAHRVRQVISQCLGLLLADNRNHTSFSIHPEYHPGGHALRQIFDLDNRRNPQLSSDYCDMS